MAAERKARANMRYVSCILLPLLGILLTTAATAADLTPIELRLLGPHAVRVRVSRGTTMPCDSGDDRPIIAGKFVLGDVVRASTPDRCVCVQQTYEPFTDVEWAAGYMACRPQICTWAGKSQRCTPAPDPTIRLTLRSQR